jgi:palmitoyltransferase ZDHHC9/14/18
VWPGNNRFCCNLITGPRSDCFTNISFYICILSLIPYYIFVAPTIWYSVSPSLVILLSIFTLLTLIFFLLTSFTDPGIIPRRSFLML